ncbi:uncharacterized protein BDZ99DRAFT_221686 [Mytilinidion resinicola]|uniref:Uncharacterized protein n=1 Tax=Mytilinidion resinicola TaxID=574789 RepID=A0A6A6XY93_9PEZI|nr:uncharacterized protein BDZ99DRAFT_221686 [Mytilinidion resinicola]KAF2801462.1 hypothetical protein BDZ99DRAFT_221686 [Mytilinidion resinicola]
MEVKVLFLSNALARMEPAMADVPETIYAIIRDPDAKGHLDNSNTAWTLEDVPDAKRRPPFRRYMIPMATPTLRIDLHCVTVLIRPPWMILLRRMLIPIEREADFLRGMALVFHRDSQVMPHIIEENPDAQVTADSLPRPRPPDTHGRKLFKQLVKRVMVRPNGGAL